MPRVVIVGAGISGLSVAFRLQQLCPAADVTVLESSNRVGGAVWTELDQGFTVEFGPNGFLDNQPSTIELAREVGLGDRLVAANDVARRNRFLFLNERITPLPNGLRSFVTSPLLSPAGKFRALAEPLVHRSRPRPETVAAFARRRFGQEAADTFMDALATGIHGGDPALLDVRSAFPRMSRYEAEAGSVVRGMLRAARSRGTPQRMWSFDGGMRVLVETLAGRLRTPPILGVSVRRLSPGAAGWTVQADGREYWDADAVVLTSPAYVQSRLLGDLDADLAALVGGIPYNRIAVVALGYREADVPRRFAGFGYIAPQWTRRDVLGVQWCSDIYPGRAPSGIVLWRALCGGWHRAEVADWPEERLVNAVRAEIHLAHGVTAPPLFVKVIRWPRAIPQLTIGHPERLARISQLLAGHPGLFVAGNAFSGVALNDCTAEAPRVAARVASFLAAC